MNDKQLNQSAGGFAKSLEAFATEVSNKTRWYWATALLVGLVSHMALDWLHQESEAFRTWRASTFQFFAESFDRKPHQPIETVVIAIGDQEYWRGAYQGRTPLKRGQLATLITRIEKLNPELIALDVHMRLQDPESGAIPPDYQQETAELALAISSAAEHTKIVLAKTVYKASLDTWNPLDRAVYAVDLDALSTFGICSRPLTRGGWAHQSASLSLRAQENIRCGFINLQEDYGQLPVFVRLKTGETVPSFGLAVAEGAASSRTDFSQWSPEERVYGTFIPQSDIQVIPEGAIRSMTSDEIEHSEIRNTIAHRAFVIGGNWSSKAYGRCERVDEHITPAGRQSGAVIHINVANALADGRVYYSGAALEVIAYVVVGLVAAILFAGITSWPKAVAALVLVLGFLFLLQIVLVAFTGLSPSFAGIVTALGLHALLDKPRTDDLFGPRA